MYSNSPIAQLSNIRIEYAGCQYPFQPYTIQMDYTGQNAGGNSSPDLAGSTKRMYYDFVNFSDGLRDRNGVLLDREQWQISPIFVWKLASNPNNDDNNCIVTLDFKTPITGCNVLVMGIYDETFQFIYDEQGKFARLGRQV